MFPPKVLIVNDDPGTLLAIQSVLENTPHASEYRVFTAQSGEEALGAVLKHDFAVILLDAKMPGMDGFQTANIIHSHPRSAAVPIIFITAYLSDEIHRLKGYETGAVDFLMTPIVPQILLAKLRVFVELTRQRLELQEQSIELVYMNSELSERQRSARERELRMRAVVDNVGEGIITLNEAGTIESFNAAATEIFGYAASEAIGQNIKLLIPPHLRARHDAGMRRARKGGTHRMIGRKNIELPALHKNGTMLPVELAINKIHLDDRLLFVGMVRDIRLRKQAEAAILAEKERLRITLNSIGDAIGDAVITADAAGRITYLNPVAVALTGWDNDAAFGQPLAEVFHAIDDETGQVVTDMSTLALTQAAVSVPADDISVVRRDGHCTPVEASAAPIRDQMGKTIGVVQVFRDISFHRRIAAEMTYQASHDALTGLINRPEFERRLAQAIQSAKVERKQHTLLYLDLDQFKIVNDTCGHDAGDELLRQLTALMQSVLRHSDTFGRLGGDEFGVLLDSCATEPALRIAEHLRQAVGDFHFVWHSKAFTVGASIGLVTFGETDTRLADILRMADSACYVAKDHGRNRTHVYTPEDQDLAQRQNEMGWIGRINKALNEGRFVLYAQKILPLNPAEEDAPHHELLLRMLDEDGTLVPPAAFIPAAERYNLMSAIDRWVVQEAFTWIGADGPASTDFSWFSINLSAASLCDEHFFSFVRKQFETHRVAPGAICFEVTESSAIANMRHAATLIRSLRNLGCHIALDDFGKGMSSFSYLKHLPVSFLKIDGGFVAEMATNKIDQALVEAINHVGHVFGLRTVAECVENEETLAALRKIRVDFAQGYLIERPRPLRK
jgi:diguanylate cyclase (GGDEF)-like protein/PAS domain S-box-containing protein